MRVLLAGRRKLAEVLLIAFGDTIDLVGFATEPEALEEMIRDLHPDAIVVDSQWRHLVPHVPKTSVTVVVFRSLGDSDADAPEAIQVLRTALALGNARALVGA